MIVRPGEGPCPVGRGGSSVRGAGGYPRRRRGGPAGLLRPGAPGVVGAVAGAGSVRWWGGGRGVAVAGGVSGVVLSLTRAAGSAAAGRVSVSVDYGGFRDAFGGGYANRLRLVGLPGCALTT